MALPGQHEFFTADFCKFLKRATVGELYNVLSALRGPDMEGNQEVVTLKSTYTIPIRVFVFLNGKVLPCDIGRPLPSSRKEKAKIFELLASQAQKALNGALSDEDGKSHFLSHAKYASMAINRFYTGGQSCPGF